MAGVFHFACEHDLFPEPGRAFDRDHSPADGYCTVLLAPRLDPLFVVGLLGTERIAVRQCTCAMGCGRAYRGAADDPGCRNGALHSGPIPEPAEPGGICRNFRGYTDAREEIHARAGLDCRRRRSASAYVGVPLLVLCLVACSGEVRASVPGLAEATETSKCGCLFGARLGPFNPAFSRVPRGGQTACVSLYSKLAVV